MTAIEKTKAIDNYKKAFSFAMARMKGMKVRNTKDAFRLANKFIKSAKPEELVKHYASVAKVEITEDVKDHVMDIARRAEFIDGSGRPTKRAKDLGVFSKNKSRAKHEHSSGLVLTPIGTMIFYTEVLLLTEALYRINNELQF